MKVQVTSSKRTRGFKLMETVSTESITFQLYRRFRRELSGDEQRLEKDNAETESSQRSAEDKAASGSGSIAGYNRDLVCASKAAALRSSGSTRPPHPKRRSLRLQ